MKMKVYISKIKNTEKLFFVSYTIYMIAFILNQTLYWRYFPEKMDRYVLLVCVLLLALNEIVSVKIINFRSLIGLIICLLLFVITYSTNGNAVAGMIVFIYCGRNISFEKIAKITIYITVFMLVLITVSSWLGIIENHIDYRGNQVRQYLGFRYSLYAPALIYNITLLDIYIKQEKLKWKNIICLLILNGFFFFFTNSRLSFGLSVLSLVIAVIYKYKFVFFNKNHFVYLILVFSYLICSGFFYGLTVTFSRNVLWMKNLNDFLGNRLNLGQYSLLEYGISAWGKQIAWVGNGLDVYGNRATGSYLWVDCLYVQVLQRYGVIFLIIFLLVMTITMWVCYQKKNYMLLILLSLIAVHCMIDDLQLYLHYNTFWFAIGSLLLGRSNKKYIKLKQMK